MRFYLSFCLAYFTWHLFDFHLYYSTYQNLILFYSWCHYILHILFDLYVRQLACFHHAGFVNNAIMNIGIQRSVLRHHFTAECNCRSYDNFMFSSLRDCQMVFIVTILHSHQQCTRIQFLCIITNAYFLFICLPRSCKVLSHCGFDLHFLMTSVISHTDLCISLKKCLFESFIHFN